MKKERSDLITESIGETIKQESPDQPGEVKRKRSKWIRWLLDFIENIFSTLSSI